MALYVYTGTYTGNATDNRWITGINDAGTLFTPVAAIISGIGSGVGNGRMKLGSPTFDSSVPMAANSVAAANGIQQFALGSMQIGTLAAVNANGSTYHFLAVGGDSTDIQAGSYTGNGVDNRHIATDFVPDLILISFTLPANSINVNPVYKTSVTASGSDTTLVWLTTAGQPDYIQQISGSGFEIGTNIRVNGVGSNHTWVGIKAGSKLQVGSYTGNGTDNRHISTGILQNPLFVQARPYVTTGNGVPIRFSTMTGDASIIISQGANTNQPTTNYIQGFSGSGFEVGSVTSVNQNLAKIEWFAFGSVPVVGSTVGSILIPSDTSISATYTSTKPSDTVITGSEQRTKPSDTYITGSELKIILSDTVLTGSEIKPITSDTVLTGSETKTILSDTTITGSELRTILSNTIITGSELKIILSDSVINGSETKTIISNSHIFGSETQTILTNTTITGSEIKNILSNSVINGSEIKTIFSNSHIFGSEIKTILSDTSISVTRQQTILSDTTIQITTQSTLLSNTYIFDGQISGIPKVHLKPYILPGHTIAKNVPNTHETQYNLPNTSIVQNTPKITKITETTPNILMYS